MDFKLELDGFGEGRSLTGTEEVQGEARCVELVTLDVGPWLELPKYASEERSEPAPVGGFSGGVCTWWMIRSPV